MILLFASGSTALVIIGLFNVPLIAFFVVRRFLNTALDDAPGWWRRLVYRGWHGKYRAFEDHRVRVIDGERDTPSQVFAADILEILGVKPSATEIAKLQARYSPHFVRGTEEPAKGEWLFIDVACLRFVRGYLDDQRTKATGKTYAFTYETARR